MMRAAELRAGDLLRFRKPWHPGGMVPSGFGVLTHWEVLRVLPGGGNRGQDVIHLWGWEINVRTFEQVNEYLAKGLVVVQRDEVTG